MALHYLDQIPLGFSNPAVSDLQAVLSDNYFCSNEVIALVRAGRADTPPGRPGAGADPARGASPAAGRLRIRQ